MEVDWLLLGYRAVASWNMQLGSRLRMPWRRSVIRTLWVDSYTFAKIERPSLASPLPVTRAEASKAACAVGSRGALVVPQAVHLEAVADRSTWPTFVPLVLLLTDVEPPANTVSSCPTMLVGKI